ncbi:hypothetical protein L5515_015689 [Caenorhabditis briggsae]|uniref:Uncharacterized protein n=1 Tax=Caenorhabditis briggsae TaxID=6238 RepID=A0AAE9EFT5_CAEBR|nr:hypothetical protein L5515_015689 [Caenorhabditis briggsae]
MKSLISDSPNNDFVCRSFPFLLIFIEILLLPFFMAILCIEAYNFDRRNGTPLVVSVKEETPIPSRQRNSSLLPDWKEDPFETRVELEVNNLARCRTKQLKMRSRFGSWKGELLLMFRGLERTE